MDVSRTTATVGIEQDPDAPHTRLTRITAQRVLAGKAIIENQVDVCSWFPAWQFFVLWMGKVKHRHTLRGCATPPHDQIGREFMDVGAGHGDRGRGHWISRRGRHVDRLVDLERVQSLRTQFAPHPALLDATERGDGIIDVVIDPHGPGVNAAGDVGGPFGIR